MDIHTTHAGTLGVKGRIFTFTFTFTFRCLEMEMDGTRNQEG